MVCATSRLRCFGSCGIPSGRGCELAGKHTRADLVSSVIFSAVLVPWLSCAARRGGRDSARASSRFASHLLLAASLDLILPSFGIANAPAGHEAPSPPWGAAGRRAAACQGVAGGDLDLREGDPGRANKHGDGPDGDLEQILSV